MNENKELQQQISMLEMRNLRDSIDNWEFDYQKFLTGVDNEIKKELSTITVEPSRMVRPLEWVNNVASTILGDFVVGANNRGCWYSLREHISVDEIYIVYYDTIEDAKNAAEAHYQDVILRCLKLSTHNPRVGAY